MDTNTSSPPPTCIIIVPCYHEEEVLPTTSKVLLQLLSKMISESLVSTESFICFVNDGSKDKTWEIIEELHEKNPRHIQGICLSRNFGHQSALLAGLHTLEADCYISIDADLQDDENAMVDMVKSFHEGNDIVYGVRQERKTDSFFKRTTALAFYKVMNLLGTHSVHNHADYRLMSKRAVHELRHYTESNVFLRGLVTELGFPSSKVYYDRKARELGESKYPLSKMIRFAWTGITSFSNTPLKLAIFLGLGTCFFSFLLLVFCLWNWWNGNTVTGWTSIIMAISFFSGIQMLLLGIIGEYIGKVFIETKRRPLFIIQKSTT